jgi:DNA-binding MarR family transcriptional regulator
LADDTPTATKPSRTGGKRRPPLALGVLEDLVGFHVRMAAAAIYRDFAAEIAPLELTQKQFAVLELIAQNPDVSQIDLATALGTDRATMMALVDRLEARGLLARRPSATDRRRQALSLTSAGDALHAAAHRAIATHEARLTADFTASELAGLTDGLRRLYRA